MRKPDEAADMAVRTADALMGLFFPESNGLGGMSNPEKPRNGGHVYRSVFFFGNPFGRTVLATPCPGENIDLRCIEKMRPELGRRLNQYHIPLINQ